MVPECFLRVHTNGVYCYVRALYLFSSSYIFTARKRSLGQANVFTPVCHSVYGGVCPTPLDADPLPGLDRPPPPPDADPPGVGQTPPGCRPRPRVGKTPLDATPPPGVGQTNPTDTVNKRAVRILLECILLLPRFTCVAHKLMR